MPSLLAGVASVCGSVYAPQALVQAQRNSSGFFLHLLSGLNNLWFYYQHLLWPVRLSPSYPYAFSLGLKNLLFLPLLALAATAGLFFAGKPGRFGAVFFVLALLPVLVRPEMATADRYAYFPSCGLFIAAGFALNALLEKLPRRRAVIFALLALPTLLFAAGSLQRITVWHDDVSLWRDAWGKYPCDGDCAVNFSDRLETAELHGEMVRVYRTVRDCGFSRETQDKLAYNAGLAFAQTGDMQNAKQVFLSIAPEFAEYHQVLNNLGMICLLNGDKKCAAQYFSAALQKNPSYQTARDNLSRLK